MPGHCGHFNPVACSYYPCLSQAGVGCSVFYPHTYPLRAPACGSKRDMFPPPLPLPRHAPFYIRHFSQCVNSPALHYLPSHLPNAPSHSIATYHPWWWCCVMLFKHEHFLPHYPQWYDILPTTTYIPPFCTTPIIPMQLFVPETGTP